jgi:dihydroneopterin aldolase
MGLIEINDLRVYAFHGVHEVEQVVGQWYVVNLSLSVDFDLAERNDDIFGTIDYSVVNDLVLTEMKIKSKLIEHVAGRIKNAIQQQFPSINTGKITVSKENPPVIGSLKTVSVTTNF